MESARTWVILDKATCATYRMWAQMAQVGSNQEKLHVRLSAADAASLRKLAQASRVSVSDMVRILIRRERVSRKSPPTMWNGRLS